MRQEAIELIPDRRAFKAWRNGNRRVRGERRAENLVTLFELSTQYQHPKIPAKLIFDTKVFSSFEKAKDEASRIQAEWQDKTRTKEGFLDITSAGEQNIPQSYVIREIDNRRVAESDRRKPEERRKKNTVHNGLVRTDG